MGRTLYKNVRMAGAIWFSSRQENASPNDGDDLIIPHDPITIGSTRFFSVRDNGGWRYRRSAGVKFALYTFGILNRITTSPVFLSISIF
jgi:hypothetical protein